MFVHDTRLRVRYAETDQMGQMYYGRYAELFEVGRVEALRALGFPYRRIEERGVMLPVRDLHVRYHKPVRYDDEIIVRTTIAEPLSVRIRFTYELLNEDGELLTEGETTLVFVDAGTKRPCRAPDDLVAAIAPFFR
ncbi:MAG: acyl-CoA thioesterase [Flavobacteriales bacterium]|nr:acyl-CoA thioesterase [Flavobacteriales bacterium]